MLLMQYLCSCGAQFRTSSAKSLHLTKHPDHRADQKGAEPAETEEANRE